MSALRYRVARAPDGVAAGCEWDEGAWASVDALHLEHHMGEQPEHWPVTRAGLLYDHEALYVRFRGRTITSSPSRRAIRG